MFMVSHNSNFKHSIFFLGKNLYLEKGKKKTPEILSLVSKNRQCFKEHGVIQLKLQ